MQSASSSFLRPMIVQDPTFDPSDAAGVAVALQITKSSTLPDVMAHIAVQLSAKCSCRTLKAHDQAISSTKALCWQASKPPLMQRWAARAALALHPSLATRQFLHLWLPENSCTAYAREVKVSGNRPVRACGPGHLKIIAICACTHLLFPFCC